MDNVIEIKNLEVKLKKFTLSNINLNIPRGIVLGLIGRNGAGKTTLLKTLTNIYEPDFGTILYDGKTMRENETEIKGKLGIVYDSLYYPVAMKAEMVAKTIGTFYPDFEMKKWNEFMERFNLNKDCVLASYSKGMQMKFMVAMVLARNPEILILDEPTAGMDPAARAELMEIIQEYMMDDRHTVIFSTHITSDLDKIADYIALISNGNLVMMDDKEKILDTYGMVQVAKDKMTDELKSKIIGVKENTFGYVGLTKEKDAFENCTRPSIEDILIYNS